MMKHVFYAIMLLGMMLTTAGCSQEEIQAPATEQSVKEEKVTITVCLPETDVDNHSRVAYDNETLNVTWQKGDRIRVETYDADNQTVAISILPLTSGANTTRAQFTGNLPTGDNYYYKLHHGMNHIFYILPPKNYGGQIQNGFNNPDHLNGNLHYSTGDKKLTLQEVLDGDFVLEPKSSVFCFNIASYPENVGTLQQIIWSSNYGDAQSGNLCMGLELASEPKALDSNENLVYIAFDPAMMKLNAGKDIVLTLIGVKGTAVVKGHSEAGKEYLPNHRYTATVTTDPNTPNALNQWTEIPKPEAHQILITTTDGKYTNTNFSNQKRIDGTNSFLIWNDNQSITVLPDYAFENNEINNQSNLLAVQLPDELEEIGTSCFRDCSALASVTLPTSGSLKTIGSTAFLSCSSLSSINFPEELTTIKSGAFQFTSIGKAVLPVSLISIESFAFMNCNELTTVHIPDNITELALNIFCKCTNLKTLTGCKGVTKIKAGAFFYCQSLTSYPFTDQVKTMEFLAFNNCASLTAPLPLTVTEMGGNIISNSGITEFTIHDNLKVIYKGDQPLLRASQLTKLNITTANDNAVNFIPEENEDNPQPGKIDLYILKDWASRTDDLKADVASKTWNGMTWKSITLIEKDGKPVVE